MQRAESLKGSDHCTLKISDYPLGPLEAAPVRDKASGRDGSAGDGGEVLPVGGTGWRTRAEEQKNAPPLASADAWPSGQNTIAARSRPDRGVSRRQPWQSCGVRR